MMVRQRVTMRKDGETLDGEAEAEDEAEGKDESEGR